MLTLTNPARMLLAALLFVGPSAHAVSVDSAVNWVASFVEESERIMAAGSPNTVARMEMTYRRFFDLNRLAERIAPKQFWLNADTQQKQRFAGIVACRLAVESIKRREKEKLVSWKIVGTRPQPWGHTVAARFVLSGNRERTVLFDVAASGSGALVVDASSESGRLSAQFSKQLERETQNVVEPSNVERWLSAVRCRIPRTL